MGTSIHRRGFLTAAGAALAACKSAGIRPDGHVFVANQSGRAVAVVDLATFTAVRLIPLDEAPHLVITHPAHDSVYVAAGSRLIEIRAATLDVAGSIMLPAPAAELAFSIDGARLYALTPGARGITWIDLGARQSDTLHQAKQGLIRLSGEPGRFAFAQEGKWAAVSVPGRGEVALLDVDALKSTASVSVGGAPYTLRFRRDNKMLVVGDRANRAAVMLNIEDPQPRVAVRVPLGLEPEQMRENTDGGQIFFTGRGADFVVTLYPYRTEVGSTTLAGRTPGYMAVSEAPEYLFVANTTDSTVTILNVANQSVAAAVGVGQVPVHISITPDGEYALVLNQGSGDMSVIRIPTLANTRTKSAGLLTQIPVGSGPVSATIRMS